MSENSKSIAERFWSHVARSTDDACWLWTGYLSPNGYARFKLSGGSKKRKLISVHRLSWELHFGPIPDGLFVLHRCDVRACVNPAHLFLGTQANNIDDMISKGRHVYVTVIGSRNGKSKLTEDQVREIRKLAAQGMSHSAIAALFGVTKSAVSHVVQRRNWKHIP